MKCRSSQVGNHGCRWFLAAVIAMLVAAGGQAQEAEPLAFPVYEARRMTGEITIDGQLSEPAWRQTSLGWGLSDAIQPNVPCPAPTLFRLGYDEKSLCLSLACYQREAQEDIPEHVWKPRETDIMDTQAVPRYDRMRGVAPPVNTADVLISNEGRTVTLHFAPPDAPTVKVHDALGERDLPLELTHAYNGKPDGPLWTVEVRVGWAQLGFAPPAAGDNWALNVYRDIRFFSNWAFIAWMRQWDKAEYSRYNLVDRFGRLVFQDAPDPDAMERAARGIAAKRGPVRMFTPEALVLVGPDGSVVRQRYAERLKSLRVYANEIFSDRSRIGCDLPYHPFFTEKKPREHLAVAAAKLARLKTAMSDPPAWDDPASGVARIAHAIPEAREGLYTYKKERLYRGLPE